MGRFIIMFCRAWVRGRVDAWMCGFVDAWIRRNIRTSDDHWWLNLYVMFSRATKMEDMLLLRPPPRTLLERGPPAAVREALQRFEEAERATIAHAKMLAKRFDIQLPDDE